MVAVTVRLMSLPRMMDLPLTAWKPAITSSMLAPVQLTLIRGICWLWLLPSARVSARLSVLGASAERSGAGAGAAATARALTAVTAPPFQARKPWSDPNDTRMASSERSTR